MKYQRIKMYAVTLSLVLAFAFFSSQAFATPMNYETFTAEGIITAHLFYDKTDSNSFGFYSQTASEISYLEIFGASDGEGASATVEFYGGLASANGNSLPVNDGFGLYTSSSDSISLTENLPSLFSFAEYPNTLLVGIGEGDDLEMFVALNGSIAPMNVVATPEPATCLLISTGLIGIIPFARRKRQSL